MKRRLSTVLAAVALAAPMVPSSSADLKPVGFMSSNVTWLANIPLDVPGIGARIAEVDGQPRMFVTSSRGLTIYDVSNPTLPVPMGALALPHWENEDVEVSADGRRVIISTDFFGPTYIIDTTMPAVPVIAAVLQVGSHTVTCADDACEWVYASEGGIYDLTDLANPRILTGAAGWQGQAQAQIGQSLAQGGHDLNRDAAGIVTTDTMPRLMLDVSDPEHPVVIGRSNNSAGVSVAYQHNNRRPDADQWQPRPSGDTLPLQPHETLAPGELLLANGETNFGPQCGANSGPFATWSLKNFDRGVRMEVLDVYRPVNGMWDDGNPGFNVMGCSGHWFDDRDGLVAASWYEHGTRFLTIGSRGEITEVGFFQPVWGSSFASYFVTDEIVYVVDFVRGIDILHFDRSAPAASPEAIEASWLAVTPNSNPVAVADRLFCRLAVS